METTGTHDVSVVIANGYLYDITNILYKHPGGTDCIINNIGKDCTLHYNMHTKSGKREWENIKIKKNCTSVNNKHICTII